MSTTVFFSILRPILGSSCISTPDGYVLAHGESLISIPFQSTGEQQVGCVMRFGDRRISMWTAIVLVGLSLPFTANPVRGQRTDPDTGRVRILYIGDGWGPSPVPYFVSDPAFMVVSVPTSEFHVGQGTENYDIADMKKFVRLYMPRTFQQLLDSADVIIVSDANAKLMDRHHFDWMVRSVTGHGLGFIMVGGLESFGAPRGEPWTGVEDILPVILWISDWIYRPFKAKPAMDHPFTRSLPWATMPYFSGTNKVTLKQEATLLLKADEIPYPPLSFVDVGEGRSVSHSSDWTPGAGELVMRWEYYPDYTANIAYLAARCQIPDDPQLMHFLRTSFWATRSRLINVMDTMSFVEKFGANTHGIGLGLEDVRAMIKEAQELYVRHEYDQSRSRIVEIDERITELHEDAIKLKDRALFWVYIIEWAATTATGLVAGFLLWSLMVRKRLYREVRATRLT